MIIIKDYNPQTITAYNDNSENTMVDLGFEDEGTAMLFYTDMVEANLTKAVAIGGTHVIINVDEIINIQLQTP